MTNRTIKLQQIPEATRKVMVAKTLQARDKVGSIAKSNINAAFSSWQTTAPMKTGAMRSAPQMQKFKGSAKLVVKDGKEMRKINAVNKNSKRHRGFYRKWSRSQGARFLNNASNLHIS